jgi:hypothetical protein
MLVHCLKELLQTFAYYLFTASVKRSHDAWNAWTGVEEVRTRGRRAWVLKTHTGSSVYALGVLLSDSNSQKTTPG